MDFSFSTIFPYAFALFIAVPFVVLLRQLVDTLILWKKQSANPNPIIENRVQAYERITLFLERIKPSNLITKFDKSLSPYEFILLTEKSIVEEYNYNASLQLYLSKSSWQNILNTKNRIIQLLQSTHNNISQETSLEDFKTLILMSYINEGEFISEAIENLKKEFLMIHIK